MHSIGHNGQRKRASWSPSYLRITVLLSVLLKSEKLISLKGNNVATGWWPIPSRACCHRPQGPILFHPKEGKRDRGTDTTGTFFWNFLSCHSHPRYFLKGKFGYCRETLGIFQNSFNLGEVSVTYSFNEMIVLTINVY